MSNGARLLRASLALGAGAAALAFATYASLQDFPRGLDIAADGVHKLQVLARDGTPLSLSLQNDWNVTDVLALEAIPDFLQAAFVESEDRRFNEHGGVDWRARGAALVQDLRARRAVRGASTITEQVVRMLHPRPRTLWSRWLEGFEAQRLERRCSKAQILEFYLNQIPYGERRRGVRQAAQLYFARDLGTLSSQEMLALAVLVRSPVGMDLRGNPQRAAAAVERLADRMLVAGRLTLTDRERMRGATPDLARAQLQLDASHFVRHVLESAAPQSARSGTIRTTLDPHLQQAAQQILDAALQRLAPRRVRDGAVVIVDHARNEILAWAVGRSDGDASLGFDTVLTPRQPGSTMKPLLYAMALERDWTAATLIDDSELAEAVGAGMHTFHNYSRVHYGPIRLREALGNSLNIPAVKTLKFVGGAPFLERLHALGVSSLKQHPDFYGDGLALGNGEVSLYQMTQAYSALARQGRYRPLTAVERAVAPADVAVFTPASATLVANILADADARRLEFGRGLQFPVETAIKTGTSTDYRDAWAIAFDYAHTVGVWVGNLDNTPMDGVTGAIGPAMILRSVFTEVNRGQQTRGLALSADLSPVRICRKDGRLTDGKCETVTEWFTPGSLPVALAAADPPPACRLLQPTPGLLVARDPRIPDELQALAMIVDCGKGDDRRITWNVDGKVVAQTAASRYAWRVSRGAHEVFARIGDARSGATTQTAVVRYYVR